MMLIPSTGNAAWWGFSILLASKLPEWKKKSCKVVLHSRKYELGVCVICLSPCPQGSDSLSTEAKCGPVCKPCTVKSPDGPCYSVKNCIMYP